MISFIDPCILYFAAWSIRKVNVSGELHFAALNANEIRKTHAANRQGEIFVIVSSIDLSKRMTKMSEPTISTTNSIHVRNPISCLLSHFQSVQNNVSAHVYLGAHRTAVG